MKLQSLNSRIGIPDDVSVRGSFESYSRTIYLFTYSTDNGTVLYVDVCFLLCDD